MNNIEKLYNDVLLICHKNSTTIWNNSWMWDENFNKIIYHHLINYGKNSRNELKFSYRNINDSQIEITYDFIENKYRIDIYTRYYSIHEYWYFNEDKWKEIENFVLKIIISEYNALQNLYSLYDLCNNKDDLYKEMNKEFRIAKLKKLINNGL